MTITDLASWSQRLTCYTAALGGWLATRRPDWWRPLLANGPFLGIRPAGSLWQFDHSPAPWVPAFGLSVHGCDDWEVAGAAMAGHRASAPVIVAGDVYRLPWQQGYRRRHAPHWFVLPSYRAPAEIRDPLELTGPEGVQKPYRAPLEEQALAEWTEALPIGDPVHELRERSVIGPAAAQLGRRYRWLAPDDTGAAPAAEEQEPYERLEGPDACHALADRLAEAGTDPAAYLQVDDFWQAARQRELVVAAAAADPGLLSAAGLTHWCAALEVWRQLPALLLRARMMARDGQPHGARPVIAALRRAAVFEGRHLVAAGPSETATDRPMPHRAELWEQR